MKKRNLLWRLWQLPGVIGSYLLSHAASRRAIAAEYYFFPKGHDAAAGDTIRITIARSGDLYEVTQVFYRDGEYYREQSWPATYGWQSTGHLAAIGSHRVLILNPSRNQLYLEEWLDTPREVVAVYQQISPIL